MVVAQPMDRYQALRQIGWIQPLDFLMIAAIVLSLLTLLFWKIFGTPSPWNVLCCVLVAFSLLQIWSILLIFRCASFVVDLHAIIHLMPENAAKIVMSAYSGGAAQRR